jgi:hypothetical protein
MGFGEFLCKIGMHKLERQYPEHVADGTWDAFFPPPATHDKCARCGEEFLIEFDCGFDGTDGY